MPLKQRKIQLKIFPIDQLMTFMKKNITEELLFLIRGK